MKDSRPREASCFISAMARAGIRRTDATSAATFRWGTIRHRPPAWGQGSPDSRMGVPDSRSHLHVGLPGAAPRAQCRIVSPLQELHSVMRVAARPGNRARMPMIGRTPDGMGARYSPPPALQDGRLPIPHRACSSASRGRSRAGAACVNDEQGHSAATRGRHRRLPAAVGYEMITSPSRRLIRRPISIALRAAKESTSVGRRPSR